MQVTNHSSQSGRFGGVAAYPSLASGRRAASTGLIRLRPSSCLIFAVLLLSSVFLINPRTAWSQANTATFLGRLTDPTGALIPGADVTLTNQDTQITQTKTTSSTGDFAFTFVSPGNYQLSINAQGFKPYVSTGITLTAGQQVRQTFSLELGEVTETVSVEGSAPLVNTVSAQQLENYSLTDARELPLQNRNFTDLLKISAGVVPSTGAQGTGVNLNGIGRNGTVYSVDGTNASGNTGSNNPGVYQGGNLVDVMSVDAIADVSIVKGAIPAEYSNALGGQVNVVSKSGTNSWHGSVFANNQTSTLAARYQRSDTKPRLVFNQFGGSVGGPIVPNRIFVFGAYEGYRYSESSFVQGNVPTQSTRDQLLAAVPDYELSLQALPLPNQPTDPGAAVGLFQATRAARRKDNHVDLRGDIVLTNTSRLSLTYNHGEPYRTIARYYIDDPRIYYNRFFRDFSG